MCATIALTILCPLKIRTLSSTLTLHFPAQGDWASKSSERSTASIPKDESRRDCHGLCEAMGPDTGSKARARRDQSIPSALPATETHRAPSAAAGARTMLDWRSACEQPGGCGEESARTAWGGFPFARNFFFFFFKYAIIFKRRDHLSPCIVLESGHTCLVLTYCIAVSMQNTLICGQDFFGGRRGRRLISKIAAVFLSFDLQKVLQRVENG